VDGKTWADSRSTLIRQLAVASIAGQLSWQHYAHGWTYFFGGTAILLSVFAMAWRFHGDRRWGRSDLLALGSGLLGLPIFAALFIVTGDEPGGHYGLVQRLSLTAGGIWVLALTIGLLAIDGRGRDPAFRLVEWIRGLPGGQLVVQPGSGLDG
jgi:peptidoglycan/LPS O-acetylase OafA/YrhL